ncbi:uncharacterized protein FIBRA_01486 [Fibroporia radiculosa]|uniref:Probable RNA polymerase II nuclear localization protein SLC7A6OS n=1 Tax=Fibroporia radiculosa TaxID=599839 RepID=J4G106_9APHY|nr:uncharacterized protein FIBRA_01486 [Fibroporia radiculosa]CCL99468.1 predicted protein [Fibroporia radiculosa]
MEEVKQQTQSTSQSDEHDRSYAILRIKRKRNEEPLDGLVVDPESVPSRKKSRGALNFFKFAATVERATFDDEQQKRDLEARLATLARKSNICASVSAPAVVEKSITSQSPSVSRPQADDPGRIYTIVKRESPSTQLPATQRRVTAPPKVWSTKELEALRQSQSGLKLYDAILSSSSLTSTVSDMDPEMANFLPMLQDYLRLDGPSMATSSASTSSFPSSANGTAPGDDNDYVYDVFYQRPTTFQELYEPSLSIMNIGTLTGVPEELMLYDSDSDSEVADTDDEDSNAEDWYKNDYPEDEFDESDSSATGAPKDIVIFWDYENTPVPAKVPKYNISMFIGRMLQTVRDRFGDTGELLVYSGLDNIGSRKAEYMKAALSHNHHGKFITCSHHRQREVVDNAIIGEMLSRPDPTTIILISSDGGVMKKEA